MNVSEIGGISISPPSGEVQVEIVRNRSIRQVPVSLLISGIPKSGYRISDVRVYPAVVELSGPQRFITEVNKIYTEDVDVDGQSESLSKRLALTIPSGIGILGEVSDQKSFVTVTIEIVPILVTMSLELEVELNNLGEGLDLIEPARVVVDVLGPIELISQLSPQLIMATVDLSDFPAGSHNVEVAVTLPDGLTVEKISPLVIDLVGVE